MRLIDADELKKAVINNFDNLQAYFPKDFIEEIDNAPTVEAVEFEYHSKLIKQAYQKGKDVRPQGEWIEFADFIARNVVSEDFSEDVDFYAEVLCRKLVKLGLVKLDGDTYKYCGADMRGKEE